MFSSNPQSMLKKLLALSASLLTIASALDLAVHLIESIAVPLLIIVGIVGALALTISLVVRRQRDW